MPIPVRLQLLQPRTSPYGAMMELTQTPKRLQTGTATWSRHKGEPRRTWILRSGAGLLASLTWEKLIGSSALARTAAGVFRYRRVGLLRQTFTLQDEHGKDVGSFSRRWTGAGTITLRNGQRCQWKPSSFWGKRWELLAVDGSRLLEVRMKVWTFNPSAEISITHNAVKYDDLPLLLTFTWYLCLEGWKDRSHG